MYALLKNKKIFGEDNGKTNETNKYDKNSGRRMVVSVRISVCKSNVRKFE